jgi:hydrogenase maturation protein HypF
VSSVSVTRWARLHLQCQGVVQGVGFRPLVHRLASELGLSGQVRNVAGAVEIDLAGRRSVLESFLLHLPRRLPPQARLEPLEPIWQALAGEPEIAGTPGVRITACAPIPLGIGLVAPGLAADLAPCRTCLTELADPADRRHGYPFISCCDCGPRYSIATAEPYARAHTTLARFGLCRDCRREFEDPVDRRFHAETIACPACGPRLALWDGAGQPLVGEGCSSGELIAAACDLLAAGRILALQGVGGFQLLVDAAHPAAVARLRRRKRRPAKPFALLVADPAGMAPFCVIDDDERRLMGSPAAPIVLVRRRVEAADAFLEVAPGSPCLGVMLPASPLHHLLAHHFGRPLVATSGNPSGEPLCIDPAEALARLGGRAREPCADAFLVHDRPIARPLDDSVLQLIDGRPALLRRARGYAPLALPLGPGVSARPEAAPGGAVALGGDLKCAPALALGGRVWLAPHLGDLADARVLSHLGEGLAELDRRYGAQVTVIGCDAHPGYLSHQLAGSQRWPRRTVQHHLAHGLAVLAEHGLEPPLLAFTWDGLGYPPASAAGMAAAGSASAGPGLWGGELLLITTTSGSRTRRLAGLLPFPMPGGDRAMREPRRAALGLLAAAGTQALAHPGAHHTLAAFAAQERALLLQAIASNCNSPASSSMGRLFDAVASLVGLVQRQSYEGEAGLRLQGAALRAPQEAASFPLPVVAAAGGAAGLDGTEPDLGWLDWRPLLKALLEAIAAGGSPEICAAGLHRSLAVALADAAMAAAEHSGCRQVALTGGCFQNRLLLESSIAALRERGLRPFWPGMVPCNDGGLALGQIWAVQGSGPAGRFDPACL